MPEISVIVRCRNEEQLIGKVLSRVFEQRGMDFEVIVVDSGSVDKTLDIARAFPVRLFEISPAEFTYGRALNLGISQASGRICALLSAHAIPFDRHWLRNLCSGFNDEKTASVGGKLMPHADCNPFDRRGLIRRYPTDPFYLTPDSPTSYSNSNAAVIKRVWEKIPYDETILYAEDLEWMRRILAAGYKIRYEPTAAVYHSHNESGAQLLGRFYNEAYGHAQMGLLSRHSAGRLLFDWFFGTGYDFFYGMIRREWHWLGYSLTRRIWMNLGRYLGSRKMEKRAGGPGLALALDRSYLAAARKINGWLTRASKRLVKWTGKSQVAMHPKHLVAEKFPSQAWYAPHLEKGAIFLDAGTAQGSHAVHALRNGLYGIGFDVDFKAMLAGNATLPLEFKEKMLFVQASGGAALPFASGSFDRVLALDVIEHVPDDRFFLREIYRVMQEGGILLLSAPNKDTPLKQRFKAAGLPWYADPDHKVEYSKQEFIRLVKDSGFEIRKIEPIVADVLWSGAIDLIGAVSLSLYARFLRLKERLVLQDEKCSTGFRVVAAKNTSIKNNS